jgi:hypothetical protein
MNRKVKALLAQLALSDPTTSQFLELSKQIADAVRMDQKEKAEKLPKEPKPLKIKIPKTTICNDCYCLVIKQLDEINQMKKEE